MSVESEVRSVDTVRAAAVVWPLFVALGLLMMGNGLLGTLLGVRAELERFATVVTGLVMASYYTGFLFGSRLAPVVVSRVGHIRVFAGLASLASAAVLVHVAFVSPASWAAMRLVSGFAAAGMYVVAESWLNERATNQTRGRLLSLYMVVLMGGMGVGQLLLVVGDPAGFRLFLLVSVLVSLAVVPVTLSVAPAPRFEVPERMGLRRVVTTAPLGAFGGLASGVANGALLGMGAVYATAVGMSPERVGVFMGAAILGAVVLQWPIGALSDRISRRQAIFFVALGAGAVAVLGAVVDPASVAMLVVMLAFGGLSFPMYSLCLAHLNDRLPAGNTLAASAAYVFVTGVGAIAGPLLAALLLVSVGDAGFWWSLVVAQAVIAAVALYRMVIARDVPPALRRAYAPVPARASALVALLTRNDRRV